VCSTGCAAMSRRNASARARVGCSS
jgi:hypothetical protein